jgi:hypothetical protein
LTHSQTRFPQTSPIAHSARKNAQPTALVARSAFSRPRNDAIIGDVHERSATTYSKCTVSDTVRTDDRDKRRRLGDVHPLADAQAGCTTPTVTYWVEITSSSLRSFWDQSSPQKTLYSQHDCRIPIASVVNLWLSIRNQFLDVLQTPHSVSLRHQTCQFIYFLVFGESSRYDMRGLPLDLDARQRTFLVRN